MTITGPCKGGASNGQSETLTIALPGYSQAVSDSNWYPSGDQSSAAVWQGSTTSSFCPGGYFDASKGASFSVDVTASDPTKSLNIRFHYKTTGSGSWSSTQAVTPTQTPSTPTPAATPAATPSAAATPAAAAAPPSASLAIVKTERDAASGGSFVRGPITVAVGDRADYQIVVTNTSSIALLVHVVDPGCVIRGGHTLDLSGIPMAAGRSLTFHCSHVIVSADRPSYTNTATANGVSSSVNASPVSSSVVANVPGGGVLAAHKSHAAKKVHKTVTHKVAKHVKAVSHKAAAPKAAVKGATFTG